MVGQADLVERARDVELAGYRALYDLEDVHFAYGLHQVHAEGAFPSLGTEKLADFLREAGLKPEIHEGEVVACSLEGVSDEVLLGISSLSTVRFAAVEVVPLLG